MLRISHVLQIGFTFMCHYPLKSQNGQIGRFGGPAQLSNYIKWYLRHSQIYNSGEY